MTDNPLHPTRGADGRNSSDSTSASQREVPAGQPEVIGRASHQPPRVPTSGPSVTDEGSRFTDRSIPGGEDPESPIAADTSLPPSGGPGESDSPRTGSLRWTLPVLVVVMVLMWWRGPSSYLAEGANNPAVGRPAPQIDLVVLNDSPRLERIQTVAEGSVSVLHFWGTWCGPCRQEFPELAAMVNRFSGQRNFQFYAISCEGHHSETLQGLYDKTQQFYRSEGIDGMSYVDPRGNTRRSVIQRLDGTMAYPTTIVIDPEGAIAGVWIGYTPSSVAQIETLIGRLLDQPKGRPVSL